MNKKHFEGLQRDANSSTPCITRKSIGRGDKFFLQIIQLNLQEIYLRIVEFFLQENQKLFNFQPKNQNKTI